MYDVDNKIFRDNSKFVTACANNNTNVLFTRPPQLGKTTLLSLAELLLSNTKTAPTGLHSYPPDEVKNSWYVIPINLGGVGFTGGAEATWEDQAREIDKKVRKTVQRRVSIFLSKHAMIKNHFETTLMDQTMNDMDAGDMISLLSDSIAHVHQSGCNDDKPKPTLLLLIDEYDKPIRDVLFDFIGSKIPDVRQKMKACYAQYVNLFDNCKSSSSNDMKVNAWVTGITPVGLTLISGFRYVDLSFQENMADAVGLRHSDVSRMLQAAIPGESFDDREQDLVLRALKKNFNNLGFPHGSPLYHTGMMNQAMYQLQQASDRNGWLANLSAITKAEEIPGSAFDLIKKSKTSQIRALVSQLADGQTLAGFSISQDMSITTLLEQGGLDTNQYLTLLLHLGVASATINKNNETEFKSTSDFYRKKHLNALNLALASSIADILKLETKEDMYDKGEDILLEFLRALSETRMAALIAWAASRKNNRILELQLQGNVVESLYDEFKTISPDVATTQEDTLDAGRSDVTITTDKCMLVLELKKKDNATEPTAHEWEAHHAQLRNYVEEHRSRTDHSKWVAGFVLVMYNGGKNYSVKKLADDA